MEPKQEHIEREERTEEDRFIDRDKSMAGKKAWKRHRSSFMKGVRERERKNMNKTFYGVTNELEEMLDESQILSGGELKNELDITFEFISGGFSAKLNEETGDISFAEKGTIKKYDDLKKVRNKLEKLLTK